VRQALVVADDERDRLREEYERMRARVEAIRRRTFPDEGGQSSGDRVPREPIDPAQGESVATEPPSEDRP
jgi:hypothetical protein